MKTRHSSTSMIVLLSMAILLTLAFLSMTQQQYARALMHRVYEDKILENGKEVIWRGTGGSYLFHTENYKNAWQDHLPEIRRMGLNTIRLAFRFPFDNVSTADALSYSELDWVLSFLAQNNIRAILDNHGGTGFGSKDLLDAWISLASRYRDDSRIVAYELFNEPYWSTWDHSKVNSRQDVFQTFNELTDSVRKVDPDHICIWPATNYLPADLEEYENQMPSNIVFTFHRWFTQGMEWEIELWGPEKMSYMVVGYAVEMRQKLHRPFWLGEFGLQRAGGGGPWAYDNANPQCQMAKQLLFRCEEQGIGWNIWQGEAMNINAHWYSERMFPLEIYNENLSRQSWVFSVPKLTDYVIDHNNEIDRLEPYLIEMRGTNDDVTFSPGIKVCIVRYDYYNYSRIYVKYEQPITEQLQIKNPFENATLRIYPLEVLIQT